MPRVTSWLSFFQATYASLTNGVIFELLSKSPGPFTSRRKRADHFAARSASKVR